MIKLENVSKSYVVGTGSGAQTLNVLKQVSIDVQAGEFVSIMGPSGSGKSTLMHVLGCLDKPTAGSYRFQGQMVELCTSAELAQIRNQEIGFVFQNFHLLGRLSALKNVELPLVYGGVGRAERRERALEMLRRVGLTDRASHLPRALSGGQKQRVAIARALVNQPSLILADEPTGALDSHTGREIMQVFQGLNEQGVTIVLITHDASVAKYAHRTVYIADGQIQHEEWA